MSSPAPPDLRHPSPRRSHQFSPPAAAPARCTARARQVAALNDVAVGFERGRFSAIMGPSGSGKTTLMDCMAGLDRLTGGQTWVGDQDLSSMNERQLARLRRDHIGFVFPGLPGAHARCQREHLPAHGPGRSQARQPWSTRSSRPWGLATGSSARPCKLSGGQQQRVAVARALASRPDIIFADEILELPRSGAEILSFMQRATVDLGQTIVMVTHNPSAARLRPPGVVFPPTQVRGEIATSPQTILEQMATLGD